MAETSVTQAQPGEVASLASSLSSPKRRLSKLETLLEDVTRPDAPDASIPFTSRPSDQNCLAQVRLGTAAGLFAALRCKHAPTASHGLRVALGCSAWSSLVELSDEQRDELEVAALLHDVGKIGVPDAVLAKPGSLSPDELAVVNRHWDLGLGILTSFCASPTLLQIVRHAPAWYDGSRQQFELAGERLPLAARVLSIVDAFDAMTANQVYRPALSRERAIHELFQFSGTQFDPKLVEQFSRLRPVDQSVWHVHSARRWLQQLKAAQGDSYWLMGRSFSQASGVVPEALLQQHLLENMNEAVVLVDRELHVLLWNHGAERLTGIFAESVYQHKWEPALVGMRDGDGRTVLKEQCPLAAVIKSGSQTYVRLDVRGRNGQRVLVNGHVAPVTAADGTTYGATLMMCDISGEASLEERLRSLHERAILDPLTQVANRAEFDRVHQLFVDVHLKRGLPCSLVMCDIDHFKNVNDTYGHQAGDDAIKCFAQLLKNSVRSGDLVARYGGEEFVVLCADCDNATVTARAEWWRSQLTQKPLLMLGGRNITASFGVTQIQPGDTPETMLRRADRALYQAKQMGRNRVVQLGTGGGEKKGPRRRWWWPFRRSTPSQLLERTLVTMVPMNIAVEKLRGFVADHDAEIVSLQGEHLRLRLSVKGRPEARGPDRPIPFVLDFNISEEHTLLSGATDPENSQALQTRLNVVITPGKCRERRLGDAADCARRLMLSFRSYLMAVDD